MLRLAKHKHIKRSPAKGLLSTTVTFKTSYLAYKP